VKGIVLAAGYGTRLGALGARLPKALLPVAGRPVIDYLLEKLARIGIGEVRIITNARFHRAFEAWARAGKFPVEIELLCDGSTDPESRLGAVRDLAFALEHTAAGEDVFVSASDNLYTGEFSCLVERFEAVRQPVVAMLREDDPAVLRRSGVAKIDAGGRMELFVEKPAEPPSSYASPPLYVYPPDVRDDIAAFLDDPAVDHDAPGNLVAYLLKRRPVYGVVMEGRRYDIGSQESYELARRKFEV
jgi:glucose-1-phosphate thymidylyltransferase